MYNGLLMHSQKHPPDYACNLVNFLSFCPRKNLRLIPALQK